MKVLHLNCDYQATTLHQLMVDKLISRDVDTSVFSPVYSNNNAVIELRDYEKAIVCFNKIDRIFFYNKQRKIIKKLEKEIDIKQYDLLHAFYLFTDGTYTRKLSNKYNIPYVVAVRNTDVNAFFKYKPYLRYVGILNMVCARKVFFLSASYRDYVINKYVPSKYKQEIIDKSVILPNGIDSFWLDNKHLNRNYKEVIERIKNRNINIVYAGSIDKNKNIIHSLRSLEILKNEGWNVHFDIIGAVVDKSEYHRIIQADFIHYSPKMPKEELIKVFRQSDIFLMPSHTETFGLVYAEAMSQGLPVLYTKGQGFDRQFEEGIVGYSVSDKDSVDVSKKIKMICLNYYEISNNCLEMVQKFSWDNIVQKYISIYKSIIFDDPSTV